MPGWGGGGFLHRTIDFELGKAEAWRDFSITMQSGRWHIAGVTLVVGLAGGWLAGRHGPGVGGAGQRAPVGSGTGAAVVVGDPGVGGATGGKPSTVAVGSGGGFESSGDLERDFKALAAMTDPLRRADATRMLADVLPLEEAERVLELAVRSLSRSDRLVLLERYFRRLAVVQPLLALQLAERATSDGLEWSLRSAVLESWAARDAVAVVRWFEGLSSPRERNQMVMLMGSVLGEHAPQQGLGLFQRLGRSEQRENYAMTFFSSWASVDPVPAAQAAVQHLSSPSTATLLGEVIGELAKRDSAAAVRLISNVQPESVQRVAWRSMIRDLSERNPQAAADLALRATGNQRMLLIQTVAEAWASVDPAAAVRWAEGLGDARLQREALALAVRQLADTDPKAALEVATRHRLGEVNQEIYRSMAAELVGRPEEAMKWLETLPTAEGRTAAFDGFVSAWAEQNPSAAAAFAVNLPPGARRNSALSTVASALAGADPEAAISWVQTLTSPQEKAAMAQSMIWTLSENDPAMGIKLIEGLSPGPSRDQLYGTLASSWAEHDLDGAVAWMKSTEDGPARKAALENIAMTWAANDPVGAADYALTLPSGDEVNNFISTIAGSWAETDSKAALAWAQRIESPEASAAAIESVVTRWAEESPTEALAYARTLTDPEAQKGAVLSGLRSWTESNPQEAARWLETLPNPELRAEATTSLVAEWASNDPVSAASWLAGQPAAGRSDEAVSSLAGSLAQFEPRSALQWAGAIQDPERRQQEVVRLAQSWMREHPEAADAWLKESKLDADTVQLIESARNNAPVESPGLPFQFRGARRRFEIFPR